MGPRGYTWLLPHSLQHYRDIIMSAMASQITSLTIVYSTVYSGADQRKYQSSASLAFVQGIPRWTGNSPHKWSVTRKMFPFDDVIMCRICNQHGDLSGWPSKVCAQTSLLENDLCWSMKRKSMSIIPLQWRHNERDGVSTHRRLDCLLNRFFQA